MPKSSITMATPSAFNRPSSARIASVSSSSRLSVISSSSRFAGNPASASAAATSLARSAGIELRRRQIHRDGEMARPLCRRRARRADHRGPDLADEAHFLRHRNEDARRHEVAVLVAQPEQCLETGQAPLVRTSRAAGNAARSCRVWTASRIVCLEPETRLQLGVHLRREKPEAVAPVCFAPVQGEIGAVQQAVRLDAVRGAIAMPMLAGGGDVVTVQDERLRQDVRAGARARSATSDLARTSHWTTANSSPPSRATMSLGTRRRRAAARPSA